MKKGSIKHVVKYLLSIIGLSGLLLFTACDNTNSSNANEDVETVPDPESGMGDADGVGIEEADIDTTAVDSTTIE